MLDLLTQHCHKRKGLGSTWTADQSDVIADYLHIGLTCVVNVEKNCTLRLFAVPKAQTDSGSHWKKRSLSTSFGNWTNSRNASAIVWGPSIPTHRHASCCLMTIDSCWVSSSKIRVLSDPGPFVPEKQCWEKHGKMMRKLAKSAQCWIQLGFITLGTEVTLPFKSVNW